MWAVNVGTGTFVVAGGDGAGDGQGDEKCEHEGGFHDELVQPKCDVAVT